MPTSLIALAEPNQIVSSKLKDSGTGNTSAKRQRVSLLPLAILTRGRFVLVLLARHR